MMSIRLSFLRENLLRLHENVELQKALHGLSIDRYVAPQPELFEPIRKMLMETGEKPWKLIYFLG